MMEPLVHRIPQSPSFTEQVRLAQSPDVLERRTVAELSRYRAVLEFSVTDRDPETRGRAATNPALPPDLLESLLADRDPWVALRALAATHPTAREWNESVAKHDARRGR